ncbi:MAG TPA: hypothetical protein PL085_06545 [Agriterribacter sp.]|nr:hypothetical protein [Agriterribacter sp.]
MNPDFDHLLQKIFCADTLEEADVLSMEQLTGQYPYFAPLQYLLAKKYRQLDYAAYKSQITKTAVFFSNPHWLNDLLLSDQEADLKNEDAGEHIVEEQPVHVLPSQPIATVSVSEEIPEENNVVLSEEFPEENTLSRPVQEEVPPHTLIEHGDNAGLPGYTTGQSNDTYFDIAVDKNSSADDFESAISVPGTGKEYLPAVQPEPRDEEQIPFQPKPEEALSDILPGEVDAVLPELSTQGGETIHLQTNSEPPENESIFLEKPSPEAPAEEAPLPATQQEFVAQEVIPAELQEDIYSNISETFPVAAETPPAALQQEEPANTKSPDIEKPADVSPEKTTLPSQLIKPDSLSFPDAGSLPLIPIEPLYAVDYFASQGIKLGNEDGKDKLSQKLRSFTEWLKTMKRIHPEKLEQEMDTQTSSVIQHIAEHSNELEDVVTEAMAEVYARQGLRNKAAEVYQKLSLLNPNKRAYFAARISKLNET